MIVTFKHSNSTEPVMARLCQSNQNGHHLSAVITANWWALREEAGRGYRHLQDQLEQLNQAFGVCMEKTKVTHTPKASGQDVLEQQPEQLTPREVALQWLACCNRPPGQDRCCAPWQAAAPGGGVLFLYRDEHLFPPDPARCPGAGAPT